MNGVNVTINPDTTSLPQALPDITDAMAILAANEVFEQQEVNRVLRRINAGLNLEVSRLREQNTRNGDQINALLDQMRALVRFTQVAAGAGGELGEQAAALLKSYTEQIPF